MVRRGEPRDEGDLVRLRAALWSDEEPAEGRAAAKTLLAGEPTGLIPAAVFVAEVDAKVVGFAEVALRSFADGCAADRPVGFLEGWYVAPEHRSGGLGRSLVEAAEAWCRDQGCREMGSDTWIENELSQQAHETLGFEMVDHCVNYRKSIESPVEEAGGSSYYMADLAALHHAYFGNAALLADTGFSGERLSGYHETEFLPGWFGYVARKAEAGS